MKKGPCRPDKSHWCVECRSSGRLVHSNVDCLNDFLLRDRKRIRQIILQLPPGDFKMSEVLSQFKIGRRICAWCEKVVGRVLDLEGDTRTICEECYEKRIK